MASGAGDEDEGSSFQIVVKTMFGEFFNLTVTNADTIKAVKQKITTKLNIPEEGFTLLYNTRELTDGSVADNDINKDSQLTLALRVQTGMKGFASAANPFLTIDQSLNHLSDKQIDEFLTGKVPLSVALRLGDTMLVINIQSSLATKEDEEMDCSKVDTHDMCDSSEAQPMTNAVLPNTLNCTGFPLYAEQDDTAGLSNRDNTTEKLLISARRDTIKHTLHDMLSRMFPDGIQTLQQVKGLRPGEILNNKTGKVTYQVKNQDVIKLSQADKHASVLTKSKFEENQKLREKVALLKQKMAMERLKKKAQRGAAHSPCGWLEESLQKHSQSTPSIVHVQKRHGYCGLKRGFLLTD